MSPHATASLADRFSFTFAGKHTETAWTESQALTWADVTSLLTTHNPGSKNGRCYTPATFKGTARKKNDAVQIGVAVLDSDSGATLEEIVAALKPKGWAAIVSSTHSHMTISTVAKLSNWTRFVSANPASTAGDFLVQEKGILPRIAIGATAGEVESGYITITHQPCPKFRIIIRLERPWIATHFPTQAEASAAWKRAYTALANALELDHDESCTDTSRLFYLPRNPPGGALPEYEVIDGNGCDIFALVQPAGPKDLLTQKIGRTAPAAKKQGEYVDQDGQFFDIGKWAARHGAQFQIADALKFRTPAALTGYVADGKVHITCPNVGAHTNERTDSATFVINAGEGSNKGFVVHCLHGHCANRDRLLFVRQFLDAGTLTIDDLMDPAFLLGDNDGPEEPPGFMNEGSREDEQVLILTPGAPLNSARQFIMREHTSQNMRTLHHQNSAFFTWESSHYVENAQEEMRARLYTFLDKAKRVTENGEIVDFDPTKSKVANAIEATAAVAQLPMTIRPPAWLDQRTGQEAADIMACANGLVHLPTRALMAHTPAFFTLNALDYAFDQNAPDPVQWLQFLATIWADDPAAIETLQEIFGLLLTGETRYQKAFLIVGPKRSGKGTIARILTLMLGAANVCGPTLSNLAQNFGIQPLIGKRLAIVSDARLGGKADQQVIVERILSITGEDSLTVDRKNREAWTGQLGVRFVIMTNELPRLSDASGALAGRFITLVMTQSFYGKENLGLTQTLAAELPSILKWALAGLDRLKARGYFVQPASSGQAQKEMEDLGSPIGAFLRDVCDVEQGLGVRTDHMYQRWCDWCREQGRDHPGTVQTFGRDLGSAIPGLATIQQRDADGSRFRFFQGVGFSKDDLSRDDTRDNASQSNSQLEPPEDHWKHLKYAQ